MAGLIIQVEPAQELITLAQAKNFLRVSVDDDDDLISMLITASREAVEEFCSRKFAPQSLLQSMDSFPYYTDTVMSQMAYPPSYYSLPMYSTTLWNYSQMIKLYYPPCIEVQGIDYTDTNGNNQTLMQDVDFLLDNINEPARIFPMPGAMWPPCLYVPNAVRIRFTAGYGSSAVDPHPVDGEIPQGAGSQPVPKRAIMAMYQLMASWYENREAVTSVDMKELPQHVKMLLWSLRVIDFQPTRG
jgi:Phage gp6-like head-tail connector protein